MTTKSLNDINKLLGIVEMAEAEAEPSKYDELSRLYICDFGALRGIENFIEACGSVEAALEILKLD